MTRLTDTTGLPDTVRAPAYDRAAHGEGIVHLGLGAFHKAHQAVYTDDALAHAGGDWRIVGVSLRSADAAEELTPQDGLFTVIEAGIEGRNARVVGSLSRALAHAHGDAEAVREALAAPGTRIVTITVTEKGYGLDRATGGADPDHPAIAHDLAHPDAPAGVAGLIVQALAARRAAGEAPFTILSCDNLPGNGELVRGLVLDMAARTDPALRDWIAAEVAFPASMVDRITPAPGPEIRDTAREMTGREDRAAVQTERFRQWVIEDRFPTGRPAWDGAGALLVDDVAPYERMKLRMLNGAHSMLAYSGFLAGHRHVRDVMADPDLAALVRRHLAAAASTLEALEGVDLGTYAEDLFKRFQNPNLAHETYQIAMDGSEKMPQRIFAPALDAVRIGLNVRSFAFATAVWIRYCLGVTEGGEAYSLRDPREGEIAAALAGMESPEATVRAVFGLPRLVPAALSEAKSFSCSVTDIFSRFARDGVRAAIAAEVSAPSP